MIIDPTSNIYSCLSPNFWLQRKCYRCQAAFTQKDLSVDNCQLSFKEVIKVDQNCLTTLVQLTHKSCCITCKDLKIKNNALSLSLTK